MTIAIIPARFHSTRFPGKLLQLIHGKSVLEHAYNHAIKSNCFDRVVISTPDLNIKEHAEKFRANVVLTPYECPNGTYRALKTLQVDPSLNNANIIINIQADHPKFAPSTVAALIDILKISDDADMATPVYKFSDPKKAQDPSVVKCLFDHENNAIYFSRSPIPYYRDTTMTKSYYHHLGIYAYKRSFLEKIEHLPHSYLEQAEGLEQLKFLEFGYRIKIAVVDEDDYSVDTPSDIEKVKNKLLLTKEF